MRCCTMTLLIVALLSPQLVADEPPKGFVSLFNGKDLTGWKATGKMDVWGAENGMIDVAGGGKIHVQHNGETLVDANLDDYVKEHGKRHPGILREQGFVGFQSYNYRVEFKNIFLKELK